MWFESDVLNKVLYGDRGLTVRYPEKAKILSGAWESVEQSVQRFESVIERELLDVLVLNETSDGTSMEIEGAAHSLIIELESIRASLNEEFKEMTGEYPELMSTINRVFALYYYGLKFDMWGLFKLSDLKILEEIRNLFHARYVAITGEVADLELIEIYAT